MNETAQMKTALESANKFSNAKVEVIGEWPFFDGVPMVKISCAAAELIPSVQYGNVTVGPVQITFFASADGEALFNKDGIKRAISLGQQTCEGAVAEDRLTVHALIRSSEQRGSK
jgi:hypothetical protein